MNLDFDMRNLNKNLYITYSNQKRRDLKKSDFIKPLDKVITLDNLIVEIFESKNFEIIIDETIGSSIIYKMIQDNNIKFFSYLSQESVSLNTIYDFIIKCRRNNIAFETILDSQKLDAIVKIDNVYQEYKKINSLVDIADIEQSVLDNVDNNFDNDYNDIYVDSFEIEDISYIKSQKQKEILDKLSKYKKIQTVKRSINSPKIIKPSNEVFDNIDEVKTAIKIARKLLEDDENAEDILIVASDIQEYASLYKLFLDEYEMKGYSSIGTPLSSFHNTQDPQVQIALNSYNAKIQLLETLYKKLNLTLSDTTKQNIKSSISILDEKIGIELTEPNQIVGLNKKYKHTIFIGTDINHFPPKSSDNFLYSYDNDLKYFKANNYFTSSQTQLNELKRLSENLYIITASYSGKRELTPSILLDGKFDNTIDVSDIKSLNDLSLHNQAQVKVSDEFYTNIKVEGIKATHLSASQINSYLACPLRYLYSNKIRLQSPSQNEEGFDVMQQGSLMHLCYELFGKFIKENHIADTTQEYLYDLMYDISIEAYNHKDTQNPRGKDKLVENIHHKIFLSTLQAGLKDDRDAGLLAKFVDYYIKYADEFNYFKDTQFEKEFALDSELKPYELKNKDDKNYFIKGFIDRFDNLENSINIVDYKSKKVKSKDKAKQEEVDTQKDVQLALYILYASQHYPNKIYDSYLLSFKGNDKGVKFASLSNEDKYNEEYENDLKQLIFDTKKNIENGEFGFDNSDEKMCGWCDVKNICQESVFGTSNNLKEK